MAHTRKTLQLDDSWDVFLTDSGNIAVAQDDAATAQDVANECRLFTEDAYFDQERGIPYYLTTLGQKPSASALRAALREQTEYVEDVAEISEIVLESLDTDTRTLTGTIKFTSKETGNELTADI